MAHLYDQEWILADYIVCNGATTPTFASGGNGVFNYPVNANLDLGYRLKWDLTGNASGAIAQIEFQGVTTSQTGSRMQSTGAAMQYTTYANLNLGLDKNTASSRHQGQAWCWFASTAPAQQRRLVMFRGSWGTTDVDALGSGLYADAVTNITSIRFNVTTGNVTGTIWLYVRNPQQ